MALRFRIEQLALAPKKDSLAIEFLQDIGLAEWTEDDVVAGGTVFGECGANRATLRFNYEAFSGKELEILKYTHGCSWVDGLTPTVSHIGMHTTEEELVEWRKVMNKWDMLVVQEVKTISHTNPAIAGKRCYHYVIFGTRWLIGTDIKFIVRHDNE